MDGQEMNQQEISLTFEYYKQQRDEMIHLGQERLSLSLQFILFIGGLVVTYFQSSQDELRFALAVFMILLGFIGLSLNINIERIRVGHMVRARAARQALGFLEPYASKAGGMGTTHIYYYLLNVLTIVFGIALGLTILLK
ncbi:MAG: hypothetical protein JNM70_02855 [Anaerolineae bacterium]|nr:hypothetical protein [Anaerolineae bacterium]